VVGTGSSVSLAVLTDHDKADIMNVDVGEAGSVDNGITPADVTLGRTTTVEVSTSTALELSGAKLVDSGNTDVAIPVVRPKLGTSKEIELLETGWKVKG